MSGRQHDHKSGATGDLRSIRPPASEAAKVGSGSTEPSIAIRRTAGTGANLPITPLFAQPFLLLTWSG
jgi:hypothetical protein